jgi:hypothetical protein
MSTTHQVPTPTGRLATVTISSDRTEAAVSMMIEGERKTVQFKARRGVSIKDPRQLAADAEQRIDGYTQSEDGEGHPVPVATAVVFGPFAVVFRSSRDSDETPWRIGFDITIAGLIFEIQLGRRDTSVTFGPSSTLIGE